MVVRCCFSAFGRQLADQTRLPEVTVRRCDRNYGFIPRMREMERVGCTACHNRLLAEVRGSVAHAVYPDPALTERLHRACRRQMELAQYERERDEALRREFEGRGPRKR